MIRIITSLGMMLEEGLRLLLSQGPNSLARIGVPTTSHKDRSCLICTTAKSHEGISVVHGDEQVCSPTVSIGQRLSEAAAPP